LNLVHPLYLQAAEESIAKAATSITRDHDQPCDIVASFGKGADMLP